MQRRLAAALVTALTLFTTGCTLPAFAPEGADDPARPGDRTSAVGEPAQWQPCPEVPKTLVGRAASGMTYECATVAVPQNWDTPRDGKTYEIEMIKVRSKKQKNRIGSLLINPGGPGASGIEYGVYLTFGQALGGLPEEITDRFDIVGFDPRGVGRSSPLRCISGKDQDALFAADPDPVSQPEFDEVAELNKRISDTCARKYGPQLPNFSTVQAARDMDALRTAVGDAKLSYLGYSYGTLLGATYAQLFPQNVRALVLDGAVNPVEGYVKRNEAQAVGFERAFTNFTSWCTQTPGKCPIAPDARGAVTDALAKAEVSPVRGTDGRDATSGWIFLGLISSLYTESGWESFATAIDDLQGGDAQGIFGLADAYADRSPDGSYTNLFDALLTVNCTDADDAPTVEEVRRLQTEWRTKYPLFGTSIATGMLGCTYWSGKPEPYPAGEAKGAPPVLVVGTTGDPATPYENTAELAKMLGVGQVLTWEGEGHTAYPDTDCIRKAVDGYLIDLKLPQKGLRCPAR